MILADGVRAVFTDRIGGFSTGPYDSRNLGLGVGDASETVLRNRARTEAELGVEGAVYMRQIHSANVVEADGRTADVPDADAVLTDRPNLALAALGADCPAVLVADAGAGLVGAAHSGRAGTLLGVVPALVARLRDRGAGDLVAAVGPAICGRCYEVPESMRDTAPEPMRSTTSWGTPALDLRAAIAAQLDELGVKALHDDRCTLETPELYSYRRDGVTGRFAGYVWLSR
ncbi:peptidoglycan editing factor PgeF [Actinocorallia libanotica]|uniref:Purine nucleoside phosphorylase n=1 Tax=Actinocorallia libanotica TaxID=46162 RepID=A0ABP4CB96_9ACTN